MVGRRTEEFRSLEDRLAYRFSDKSLLQRALTHVSASDAAVCGNYQRLEFLGDRVLGVSVAAMLYSAFPDAPEGEMSRRLAELVRRETCADVARGWNVGRHIRLGTGESQSGGRKNQTILADICEAILGAVFIDGGYQAARDLIERTFAERLAAPRRPLRDAKTALQEWAQSLGKPPPVYEQVNRSGPDHSPTFTIAAIVSGLDRGLGEGNSKRVAEQNAATAVLVREGIWQDEAPNSRTESGDK